MIAIDITGPDGNAYAIMGYVRQAMKTEGYNINEINDVLNDMMSSDYEHLCDVAEEYITLIGRE